MNPACPLPDNNTGDGINYLQKSLLFDKKLLKIPLCESKEELVSLKTLFLRWKLPFIFEKNHTLDGAEKCLYLRRSVALKSVEAAKDFYNEGCILKMEDAYRSLEQQRERFLSKMEQIKKEFPQYSSEECQTVANVFIAGIPLLAAHTAGAAIDVSLIDKKTNQPIDFGCTCYDLDKRAISDYPNISEEAKKNRQYLISTMEKHGLINYPFEFWHFSFGDVVETYISKKDCVIYGPLEFDPNKGLLKHYPVDKLCSYFSIEKAEL